MQPQMRLHVTCAVYTVVSALRRLAQSSLFLTCGSDTLPRFRGCYAASPCASQPGLRLPSLERRVAGRARPFRGSCGSMPPSAVLSSSCQAGEEGEVAVVWICDDLAAPMRARTSRHCFRCEQQEEGGIVWA